MTTEKLLPCPFCGCKAVWFKTGRDIGIECEDGFDCPGRAQTNVYEPQYRQDVIAQWNRRVLPTGEDIRDLADLEAGLRASSAPAQGMVLVPRELVAFLDGESAIDGVWFGERHPDHKGLFWWRKALMQCAASHGAASVAAGEMQP
jgi:hypothetical protein